MPDFRQQQIERAEQLAERLHAGGPTLAQFVHYPEPERQLAAEIVRGTHDVIGGLTAARVALAEIMVGSPAGRIAARKAEAAIIAAERAVLEYRDAQANAAGMSPSECEEGRDDEPNVDDLDGPVAQARGI